MQAQTHDILTADEVGAMLRLSKYQIYELAKACSRRGDVRANPLPCLRIGRAVRFRRVDVEAWLSTLSNASHDPSMTERSL